MSDFKDKQVLVIGLGGRGQAACELLLRAGAKVAAIDSGNAEDLRDAASRLRSGGVQVELGVAALPQKNFDLAVVSPAVPPHSAVVQALRERNVPVIGELELGFQHIKCLSIAISGTNGKATTAELVERTLANNHRKIVHAGHAGQPVCSVADQTKDLDFFVLQVSGTQLETTDTFAPTVAVLLNLSPEPSDRYATKADQVRAMSRLFRKQQGFDWAIVEWESIAPLKELGLLPPSKLITFSAHDDKADLYLDRGLIISRLGNWSGPLLDTSHCLLRGPHNAENLMAAVAVGHVLRLPLDSMVDTLKMQPPGPHRFEPVAEINGVEYINDSKATNLDALRGALLAAQPGEGAPPNIWLIAGGKDSTQDFHAVGPQISKRVKGAFLIGEAREKIRSAWSLFTPCELSDSLLEAVTEAAKNATAGDVILLSPACSSFDQFQNYQQRGERFCQIVESISRGQPAADPNITGKTTTL